eukprot:6804633-Lingulodinium_polyedra.AAC.1
MQVAGLKAVNTFPSAGATLERAFTRRAWNGLQSSQIDYVLGPRKAEASWSVWNSKQWRNSDHFPVVVNLSVKKPLR